VSGGFITSVKHPGDIHKTKAAFVAFLFMEYDDALWYTVVIKFVPAFGTDG
jgi:hypothetical protein